jgi:hypothetical protein
MSSHSQGLVPGTMSVSGLRLLCEEGRWEERKSCQEGAVV